MIELPFARDEYQQRLRKIRIEMAKRGLELLIVNDVANQHYITGYDGWSFYTPQLVLVPVEEVEPVWIGGAMGCGRRSSDGLDETGERGWLSGGPCSACRSPSHGLDRKAAQIAGSPDFAGDITALPPTILGGENASAPHIMWSDRRFGDNETIALELAGVCRRYAAGLARTMQLGKTPTNVSDTAKAVIEGMDAVLDAVRPGTSAEAVEAAWRKVIQRYGLKKESRIGYSIGVAYPPDWGEHTISLRPGDKTVLEPGNVVHSILGMWMDGWGIEISETILVTATGNETLTRFPRDIHVKS